MAAQLAKRAIECGPHSFAHARLHQRSYAQQCQRRIADEGRGRTAHALSERRIRQQIAELVRELGRRRCLSLYCQFISQFYEEIRKPIFHRQAPIGLSELEGSRPASMKIHSSSIELRAIDTKHVAIKFTLFSSY